MEHIQRAIEKARSEREGAIGQKTGAQKDESYSAANAQISVKREARRNTSVDVEYSKTQRISMQKVFTL